MGSPPWALDPALATTAGRVARQDELDQQLGAWTKNFDRHDLMHRLQAAGVAAGAVQHARDLAEDDPQIAARGTFFELDHPVIGPALFEGQPMRMSAVEPDNWRSAPLLGEDNDYVFGELLGLGADERDRLRAQGVI
jgi:crotonobetainyl-CoA:carnitine CoA-transferase CaiB-like acyl-CoA transferase